MQTDIHDNVFVLFIKIQYTFFVTQTRHYLRYIYYIIVITLYDISLTILLLKVFHIFPVLYFEFQMFSIEIQINK